MSAGTLLPHGSDREREFAKAAVHLVRLIHNATNSTPDEILQSTVAAFPHVASDREMLVELKLVSLLATAIVRAQGGEAIDNAVAELERELDSYAVLPSDRPAAPGAPANRDVNESDMEGELTARAAPLRRIGNVIVLRRRTPLGTGMNSRVYYGIDPLECEVYAVKLLEVELLTAKALERFKNEIRLLSGLHVSGVIRLYDWGRVGTVWYLIMDLVDGTTLADRSQDHWSSRERAARVISLAAKAVHAIHMEGVIHRDLKPSNVLLDTEGNVVIGDFGLARGITERDYEFTVAGQMLGTPAYMAPEQLSSGKDVGIPADVHALGAMLYHFTTGRLPFLGRSLAESLWLLETSSPPAPSEIDPTYPPGLEQICLRCLNKDPTARYSTCLELAEALDRWLETAEGSASWLRRFRRGTTRLVRRYAALTALLVAAAAMLALGMTLSVTGRPPAQPVASVPPAIVDVLSSFWSNDPLGAAERASHLSEKQRAQAHPWALGIVDMAVSGHADRQFLAHRGAVYELAVGPREELVVTTGEDGAVRAWNLKTGRLFHEIRARGPETNGVSFGRNGDFIVWGDDSGHVSCWSLVEQTLLWSRKVAGAAVYPVVYISEEDIVAAGTQAGSVVLLGAMGQTIASLPADGPVEFMSWDPYGKRLLVATTGGAAAWTPHKGEKPVLKRLVRGTDCRVIIPMPHDRFAIGTSPGVIELVDEETGERTQLPGIHGRAPTAMVAASQVDLFTAARDHTVWWRHIELGINRAVLVHPDRVWDVEVLAGGEKLATACADGRVRFWNLRKHGVVADAPLPDLITHDVAPTTSESVRVWGWGGMALVPLPLPGSSGANARPPEAMWMGATRENEPWFDTSGNMYTFRDGAVFCNGYRIRATDDQGLAVAFPGTSVCGVADGRTITLRAGDATIWRTVVPGEVLSLTLSADTTSIYYATTDEFGRLDSKSGAVQARYASRPRLIATVVGDRGRFVALRYSSGVVELLDAVTLAPLMKLEATRSAQVAVAISPGEHLFAVGDYGGTVRVVDTASGQIVSTVRLGAASPFGVKGVSFSRDGKRLLLVGMFYGDYKRLPRGRLVVIGAPPGN